jgi:hypothetical protein
MGEFSPNLVTLEHWDRKGRCVGSWQSVLCEGLISSPDFVAIVLQNVCQTLD